MSIAYAQQSVAKTLGYRGVKDADRVAHEVLEALRNDGLHLVSVPTFTTDPPKGSPEYNVAVRIGNGERYFADPKHVKRILVATVDDDALAVTTIVSPYEVVAFDADGSLRKVVREEMGMRLLADMWKRLDPAGASEHAPRLAA